MLHPKLKKLIAQELNITSQSVDMSLCFAFNSETAVEVRKRAKKLLLVEAEKIDE